VGRPPSISAVILTRNEEAQIGACLDGLRWCDESVVVDCFSTDRTVEIARERAAKVVLRAWPGMWGPQRNAGLAAASGEWVLMIDADERVPDDLRDELATLAADPGRYAGAWIPRKNFFFGRWLAHGGCYPDYQMRFFRRDRCRYNETAGHGADTPILDGETKHLERPMLHFTGQTVSDRIRKMDIDAGIHAREKLGRVRRVGARDLVLHPLATFFRVYVSRKGYRDGTEGLIFAVLSAVYNFVMYAKLRELIAAPRGAGPAGEP